MKRNMLCYTLLLLTLAGIGWVALPNTVQAGGIVGEGTAASCTEDALRSALAGGGDVTFNCGPSPVTISLMFPNDITSNTVIDGGGLVTLDGGDSTQLFIVNPGVQLDVRNITLANGGATRGGAIFNNGGTVNLSDASLIGNAADALRDPATDGRGGAIFNNGGRVAAVRTDFVANLALYDSAYDGTGGAIYSQGGSLFIAESRFVANVVSADGTDGKGGAIAAQNAQLDLQNNKFALNIAGWSGGAIWMQDSTFQYVGNSADFNIADQDGGAIRSENSSGAFLDSTFKNNRANRRHGGALHLTGGFNTSTDTYETPSIGIKGNHFENNWAADSGGGILVTGVALNIFQTRFIVNEAGFGGALIIEDPFTEGVGELYADEVEFRSNEARAGSGGAVALGTRRTTITRALFYNNQSHDTQAAWLRPGGGGAAYIYNGNYAVFQNTTFSFNKADLGGALFIDAEDRSPGSADVIYSTFYKNSANGDASAIYGESRIFAHNLVYAEEGAGVRNCNRDQGGGRGELSYQFPDSSCGGALPVIDPRLQPISTNGGFTFTHDFRNDGAPSDAIDRIPPGTDGNCDYDTRDDQRTETRPFDATGDGAAACDLGAVETRKTFGPVTEGLTEVTPTPAPVPTDTPVPFIPQCGNFTVLAPRDGLANGQQAFYWEPAPDATGYQLLIYDAEQGPLLASYDIPAPASSATLDVSSNAIGGSFLLRYELHALYNGQIFCTDTVSLQREPPAPLQGQPDQPAQPVCGNGVCEQGENPNNCQADGCNGKK